MRTTLALPTGTAIEVVTETTTSGRKIYRVLTGRVTGTFVVAPAANHDAFDTADYYTAMRIQFGDGPGKDPAHWLGRPVASPGEIELYGHVEITDGDHWGPDDELGQWRYVRRDAERTVPLSTAKAVRTVCTAIARDARANFLYIGLVADHLRAIAPEMLDLIEQRVKHLNDRLRAARLEIMLWEYRRDQWTAAHNPARPRTKPTATKACADIIAALEARGLTARIHRIHRSGVAGLRIDLKDGTHLVISDRRGALPLSPADRTGWHVHQFPTREMRHGPGRVVYDSSTAIIPDADTDAMIATVAALAAQGQSVPPGWTGA
jgi:hypothetical protein